MSRFKEFLNEQKTYQENEVGVLGYDIQAASKLGKKNWTSYGSMLFGRAKKGIDKKIDNIEKFLKSNGFEKEGNKGFWQQKDSEIMVDLHKSGEDTIEVNIGTREDIMKSRRAQKKVKRSMSS